MKRTLPLWSLLLLLCAANANAQMYKWIGPDGKITYTDTPPPPSAKQVETKAIAAAAEVNTSGFPYELSEAVKRSPVTLYTTKKCDPCDEGRKLLTARGIPFAEKTVSSNEDIAEFRKLAGDNQLPVLQVGRNKELGFEPGGWNTTLTSAGYPETSKLPRSYRNPPAQAAAPATPKAAASKQEGQAARSESAAGTTESPPATGNAPPGFRF
jgi:glutaredoxin